MAGFLFTSALRDFFSPKRVIVWLAVIVALFGLSEVWLMVTGLDAPREQYGQLSSIFVLRLVALAAAIFSTAIVSQEVEQKTIVYLLTRPVPRWLILLMRGLAATVTVFVISALAAAAVSLAVFGPRGLGTDLFFNDLKTLLFGSAAYLTLFMFVTLVMNRAMIVSLLYAFGWETAIPNFQGDLYYLSIYSHLTAIAEHPQAESGSRLAGALMGQFSVNELTPSVSVPVLLLTIAVVTGLSLWWFSHFEYLPREDAE